MYGLFAKTLTKGDRRKEELKQTNKNCKNERGKGYAEQRARTVSSLAPHHHSRVITQVITVSSRASVAPWPSLALFSKAFHHPLSFPSFIAGLVIFPSQLRQSIFLLSPSPIPPLLPCLSLVLFGHTSCLTASRYTLPLQDPSAKLVNHSSILWPVMKRGSVVTCGWPGPPTWSTSVSGHFHLSWSTAKHANPSSFGLASSRELGAPDLRSRYLVHLDCSHTIRFLQTSTLTP